MTSVYNMSRHRVTTWKGKSQPEKVSRELEGYATTWKDKSQRKDKAQPGRATWKDKSQPGRAICDMEERLVTNR